MNTKLLMTSSALFLGIIGFSLSFLPKEIASYFSMESNTITILLLQILSAFYMGFGILNWMAKGAIIGGIYNKPIAIGNLTHFGVGAIAFFKILPEIQIHSEIMILLTFIYTLFALGFAYVFKVNPKEVK